MHARVHEIPRNPRQKVDRELGMNPNLGENFIVYSGRVPTHKCAVCWDEEDRKRERTRERAPLRSYGIEGTDGREGRPKSLDFIASLNGLQSNACTTRREIAQPFCGHNFRRTLQITITYLK